MTTPGTEPTTTEPSEPYRRKLATLFAVSFASIHSKPDGSLSRAYRAGVSR